MRRVLNILDVLRKVRPSSKRESEQRIKSYKIDNAMDDKTSGVKSSDPGTEVLWRNLRHVLNICGGQQKPPKMTNTELDVESGALVNVLEVQRFVSDVFAAMDVPSRAASEMADALIAADYMGQRSMGIHRLPSIASDLLNLRIDARMQPKVLCEREALALVDGQNAPGPVVANFCMDLAMLKARDQGIGFVAARRSNNIGMASWYACQALAQRMIGLCMSNGRTILVPSGGIEPLLGDNSMAFAAASTQEQFLMDMGMSAYRIEQLELDYCNGYLQQLPLIWHWTAMVRPRQILQRLCRHNVCIPSRRNTKDSDYPQWSIYFAV